MHELFKHYFTKEKTRHLAHVTTQPRRASHAVGNHGRSIILHIIEITSGNS